MIHIYINMCEREKGPINKFVHYFNKLLLKQRGGSREHIEKSRGAMGPSPLLPSIYIYIYILVANLCDAQENY